MTTRPGAAAAWSCMTADSKPPALVDASLFTAALDAALEAGDLQLARHADVGAPRSKSAARDLVTEVDVDCERLLVARLRAAAPGHAIEAEEEVHDARAPGPRWFLDPLDGTVNYVHRLPLFSVSVALFDGDTPQLGIVHAPRLAETFVALAGAGAWLLDGDAPARRLEVSAAESLGDAVLGTGFPYRRGELEHSNLANFGRFFHDVRGLRRMGSAALDLAFVAAGRLDGFWELHLAPHDVAAGALLVREAGGEVTDADGGGDWLRGGHIVAAPAALAGALRARIEH